MGEIHATEAPRGDPPRPRWAGIAGPVLVAATIGLVEASASFGLRVPNPPAILLMIVVFSAFSGGQRSGLVATVIAGCATMGAFLPAPLLAGLGWNGTNLVVLPLCAAGIFLCWKAYQGVDHHVEPSFTIR